MLSLKEQHARTLLIHYSWDVEKVIRVLVEQGKERLFVQAGVIVVEHIDTFSSSQSSTNFSCNIFFEDVSSQEVTTMDCGHCFCNSCKYADLNILLLLHPFSVLTLELFVF